MGHFSVALLGDRGRNVRSIHRAIIGGQKPKYGVHSSLGTKPYYSITQVPIHIWPLSQYKRLSELDTQARSIHTGIIGGQGPKCGVHLWEHFWGPGAEKYGAFIHEEILLLGARGQI